MTVTYSNSVEDLQALKKHIDKKYKKKNIRSTIFSVLILLCFNGRMIIESEPKLFKILLVNIFLLAVIIILSYIENRLNNSKFKEILPCFTDITVTLKDDVFETSHNSEKALIKYESVGEIGRGKGCFIVTFEKEDYRIPLFSLVRGFGFVRANVIPVSAFGSEEQADAFFDMLKEKTAKTKNS
ncbi:MAG: hypothetical protein FWF82_07235 [Oscillospiraceae bacterium]|nr:hypothetical protein [Oscillospiraceae bacterium]